MSAVATIDGMQRQVDRFPVFYSPRMVAARNASASPSAQKPAAVVASWRTLGVPLAWHEPAPATRAELCGAHDARFVDDVLACRINNGFENRSRDVAQSLPWTSGAMLSAARHVIATRAPVAAAPCSGFHHASWARADGFCTFNGLMVAATALKTDDARVRVGIIDCDYHNGDGTDAIIARIDAKAWCRHFTAGARFNTTAHTNAFFGELPAIVRGFRECDVVLYQAGADPHVDDPFGGFLTTDELARRDRIVFDGLRDVGVPVVWNLAGGYQVERDGTIPRVLEIHDNTLLAASSVHLTHP